MHLSGCSSLGPCPFSSPSVAFVRFLRVCQSLRARELESSRELESAREVPGILFITIEIPCFFFSCDKLKRCLRAHLFFSSVRAAGRAVFVCDGTLHCAFNNYLYLQILTQLPCLFSESRVSVRLPHSVTCSVLTCCSHACVCEAVSSTGSMFYLVRSHFVIW